MEFFYIPDIYVKRNKTPVIYLDSCAMIELARYEKGKCTDAHKQEIGELYALLSSMMRDKRILCPLGNQLQEMGMTKDREQAKMFLYQFTNAEMLHPDVIQNKQMELGYRAFSGDNQAIIFDKSTAFKEDEYPHSPFVIHVAPVYSSEKAESLRREKFNIVDILNEMKTNKKIQPDFNSQLRAELESEFIMFRDRILGRQPSTEEEYLYYVDEVEKFYRITGFNPQSAKEQFEDEYIRYGAFLWSPYHDLLPYIWIRANLWSHLMQRPNKIICGDNLDVQWAAAYLPYVDYAVTDHAFCALLNSSGLAVQYGTKVYSLGTLGSLLGELKSMMN